MTIFDTIRYPISDPPTHEELEALPAEIFDAWKEQMGLTSQHHTTYLENINLLRQMIKDYDNL